jgi:hypothetical protein
MKKVKITIEAEVVTTVDYSKEDFEEFLDWLYSSSHINPKNPLYIEYLQNQVLNAELIEYKII